MTRHEYDEASNLKLSTDANNAITQRTYDALNRLTSSVATKGATSETVGYAYDAATSGRFSIGRLSAMSDPTGSTSYFYDRRGLVREEQKNIASAVYSTTYQHDANGNRNAIRSPSARIVSFMFDFANRPVSATTTAAGTTTSLVTSANYFPFGPATELVYGNGSTRTRVFDARHRIFTNTLTGANGQIVASYQYGYDGAGNVLHLHDLVTPGYDRDFAYDDLSRLVTANTGAALWRTGSYTYDAMGNLLSAGSATVNYYRTFSYAGTTPKLVSEAEGGTTRPVTYDAAGNEIAVGTSTFAYSPRGYLSSRDGVTYGYDGRGIRTTRTDSGGARQITLYDPDLRLLGETESSTSSAPPIAYDYIWFDGEPLAQATSTTNALRWYFNDHLGQPILLTDASTAVVWRAEYEPYGAVNTYRAGASEHQPLRFPGQEQEQGSDLSYNIFRWYRAGWGRYTQVDPVGLRIGSSTNLYSYVDGRPTFAFDRLGLVSSAADCPKNACCTPAAMEQEFQKAWNFALTHQKDYDLSIGSLCSGQSCDTSAFELRKDIEEFVKPKCWVTSSQLTKGGLLGKVINPVTKFLFGINAWVHVVVKFKPCNADLSSKYIDLYTHPNYGVLDPSQELDHP